MHHPWQVGPVSPLDRIVVTSLVALATDSVFLWRATPHEAISVLLFLTPAVIAIRIIRGFPIWRPVATGILGAAGTIAVISASRATLSSHQPALVVAAVAAAAGLVASAGAWVERRWTWPPTTLASLSSGQWPVVAPTGPDTGR